ncbi:hypothetical protein BAOM_4593 [Peribacillus asahii]|uniref:Uncharacterized protein n=1 Tax=Peribacillus asahii TaxID=228899 RepID=A0A3Q9RR03_9BACI|nr:hypothetical protein [Peribacillus asahii]AZV45172.1 hypothetical protein BAOM_4593 [Peribacillus asahii]
MLSDKGFMIVDGIDLNAIEIPEGKPQVPNALAAILYEQALPVKAILAKYAKLTFDAGQVLDIDNSKLTDYKTMLKVASYADNATLLELSAFALHEAIQTVRNRAEYDASFLSRRLYEWLSMAENHACLTDIFYDGTPEERAEQLALYEQLKSDAELTAKLSQQYKGELEEWETKLR